MPLVLGFYLGILFSDSFTICRFFLNRIRTSALLGRCQCQDLPPRSLRIRRQPAVHRRQRQRRRGVGCAQGHRPEVQGYLQPQPDAGWGLGDHRPPRTGAGDGLRHPTQPDDVPVLRYLPPTVRPYPRPGPWEQLEDQVHQRQPRLERGRLRGPEAGQLHDGARGDGDGPQLTAAGAPQSLPKEIKSEFFLEHFGAKKIKIKSKSKRKLIRSDGRRN